MNAPSGQNGRFQKKFTAELIENELSRGDRTLRELMKALGCSKSTAENLVYELEASNRITKRNLRTDLKPMWMYSLK